MKTAVLFAGQGSQFVGMAKDLYENNKMAKEICDRTDKLLGINLSSICFNGPDDQLMKTENTQPAILMMSYICYKLIEEAGIKADAFAGFSLGEYSALTSAGYISFDDGIRLVKERGLIMDRAVKGMNGGMAAVMGLEDAQVEEACSKVNGIVVPANYNCPGQLVISGEMSAVEEACRLCTEAGAKRAIVLKVSGPFHSPLLKVAAGELKTALDNVKFAEGLNKKVVSNVTAVYHNEPKIKDLLVEQMYSPVRWRKSMEALVNEGYDTFIEVGPGKTLNGFMKKIAPNVNVYNVGSVESFDATVKAIKG